MEIKVKCKLTNHIYWRNIVSFLSPYCHKVSTKLAHNVGPLTAQQLEAIEMTYRWRAFDGPTLNAFWAGDFSFISAKTYELVLKRTVSMRGSF